MKAMLLQLLPGLLPQHVTLEEPSVYAGKPDLLKKLEGRLRGFAHDPSIRVVVLVDRDKDDCSELKRRLDDTVKRAGLSLCRAGQQTPGRVLTRIVIEELEAWFLGDIPALATAYPKLSKTLGERRGYRVPDDIVGPAEAMLRALNGAGYHMSRLRKLELAEKVAPHLDPDSNESASFRAFVSGVRYLVEGAA